MDDFSEKLAALTSMEASLCKNDPDRMGVMIERLAVSLGFSIAIASRGDGAIIDTLIEGATAYAHEEAVGKARFAAFMARRT